MECWANDTAGNSAFGVNRTLTVDTTIPELRIKNPLNQSYTAVRSLLNYTVSDNIALGTCIYSLDDWSTNTTVTCGNNVSGLNSGEGQSTWSVYANDTSGNSNTTSISFFVETPSGSTPSSGGGGGGGGAVVSKVYSFGLNKEFFTIEMVKGKTYQEQIILTNDGTEDLTINISITNLEKFVFPGEENFVLKRGEIKSINFNIYVSEIEGADVYVGKINFSSQNIDKSVNVVLDVKDKFPLFDIKTTILKKYVAPRGKVIANIFILNLGDLRNIDVDLEYQVRDFDNITYTSKKEAFALNESFTGDVFLEIPKDTKIGNYIFYSTVNYGNISASSYDTFIVEKISIVIWMIIVLIIFVVIILLFVIIKRKKDKDDAEN